MWRPHPRKGVRLGDMLRSMAGTITTFNFFGFHGTIQFIFVNLWRVLKDSRVRGQHEVFGLWLDVGVKLAN